MPVEPILGVQSGSFLYWFGQDDGPPDGDNNVRAPSYTNADATAEAFYAALTVGSAGFVGFEDFANDASNPVVNFGNGVTATFANGPFVKVISDPAGTNGAGRYPRFGTRYLEVQGGTLDPDSNPNPDKVTFSPAIAAFGGYAIDLGDWAADGLYGYLLLEVTFDDASVETLQFPNMVNALGDAPAEGSMSFFGLVPTNGKLISQIAFHNPTTGTDVWGFDHFYAATSAEVDVQQPCGYYSRRRRLSETDCDDTLTDNDIISGDWRAGDSAIINEVIFSVDWDEDLGEYTKHLIYRADDSIAKYGRRTPLQISSKGIQTNPNHGCSRCAYTMMDERAYNVFARFADPPPTLEVAVFYRKHAWQVGDLICVTSAFVPNTVTGLRGIDEEKFEIVNIRYDFAPEGKVILTLLDVEAITLPREPIRWSPEDNARAGVVVRAQEPDDDVLPWRCAIPEDEELLAA